MAAVLVNRRIVLIAMCCCCCMAAGAQTRIDPPAKIEVGFGPENDRVERFVLRCLAEATGSIRLAAYAFSAPRIVDALIDAHKRGVDVKLVVDFRHNIEEDRKGLGRTAPNRLVNAGIAVRTNNLYRTHHDKYSVIDERTVQTASYNYADSAKLNSENAIVVQNDKAVAAQYLAHWNERYRTGHDYNTH